MRVLVIGGTRFIGPHVVRQLLEAGHEVTIFHRGQSKADLPANVHYMIGDRRNLSDFRDDFAAFAPDVVLDMAPYFEYDAKMAMSTFKGIAKRLVAISSCDVYRAFGRVIHIDDGEIERGLLTEESPLRRNLYPHRGKREGFDDYEKILVERAVMDEPELPGTVLRLPMVYGPGDYQHRMYADLKRMMDHRPAILMEETLVDWRWTRGYVEDVAAAIVLAVTDDRAAGRIYNVGEREALTMRQWVESIARSLGWNGKIIALPDEQLPEELKLGINTAQHMMCDTSKIRQELGFVEIISPEEAISRTIRWEEANPPAQAKPIDYSVEDKILAKAAQI